MKQNCLVTGGMGFIGKHLVHQLLQEGDTVTIVDDLSSSLPDQELLKNSAISFCDQDFGSWEPPRGQEYHKIFHLASPVGPVGILKYAGHMGKIIVDHTYKIAQLSIDMNSRLIVTSTSEVYGKHPDNEQEGQRESLELVIPQNITVRLEYAVGKALGEILLKNLSRHNKLSYVCVRPFNIVGPSQSDDLGFVIPRFLKQALSKEPITVYGDGSQKRTFTHVKDIVDAMYKLSSSDVSGEVFNIGNPANVLSIKELAERVRDVVGSSSKIELVNPQSLFGDDVAEAWNKIPNIEKIHSLTGWTPKYSLDDILHEVGSLGEQYLLGHGV